MVRAAMRSSTAAILLAIVAAPARAEQPPPAENPGHVFFEKKIRPILVEHCYSCHSVDAKKNKGGLYLDSRAGLLKGGDSGPALVPGRPERSLLVKVIQYGDPNVKMPPKTKLPN